MKKRKADVIKGGLAMIHQSSFFVGPMFNWCAKLLKKCWIPFAILVITLALLISVFRALTPWAKQYKHEVEHHLSVLLGQSVNIKSMETSWYWFEPVLKLNDVRISDVKNNVLNLNKLLVGINVLSSLWHWHVQPGIFYVDGLQLSLRQLNHHWEVDGLRPSNQVTNIDPDAFLPVMGWLLRQQKIVIKNVSALVHLGDGTLLPISGLHITVVNHGGRYRLKGTAKLAQTTPTTLILLADLTINPSALNKLKGHVYLSLRQFLPAQWQGLFPPTAYHIDNGRGDLEAWLDVTKGHISGGQSKVHLYRMAWSKAGKPQPQLIQYLQANLAWKALKDGWELRGDKIKLRSYGQWWPENALLFSHQKSQEMYRLFVKHILIEPLIATNIEWPEIIQPIISRHPRGHLSDAQLVIKQGQIDYVLGRFSNLSWQPQGHMPGVTHLSGGVSWQPTGGRLELDGENTTIQLKKLPPVTFAQFNAAMEWKELSHGLRLSLDRLVLSRPDLVLSARGALDEPLLPDARHLQMTAELSADHAAKWLAYIPSNALKPKLEHWLKHDIKKIDNVSAQLSIDGPLIHFPFDTNPGEFSIVSRFSGMDLMFHPHWPLARDIDTVIRLNKRSLEFEVLHADLNGVDVDQVNLRIDDLGMDKETLWLHAQVKAPASKIKSYVFSSPLKQHLGRLETLEITDELGLNLRLEIPLYPENDEVLVRGELAFDDNDLAFHHALSDWHINHVLGVLNFNEHGVMESHLRGELLGGPVTVHLQSIHEPKSATEVSLMGDVTINSLKEYFKAPILSVIQGHTRMVSQLLLTDDPADFDQIKISTDLTGVEINMPQPLGKSFEDRVPLNIQVGFNKEKPLRLQFNYDDRLSSDVWFAQAKGIYELDGGRILVGAGPAQWNKKKGVQVYGALPVLDVQQWREKISKLSTHVSSPDWLNHIQSINMNLGHLIWGGRHYLNASLNANKLTKDSWMVHFEQRDIAGDVTYSYPANRLSGRMKRLFLPKLELDGKVSSPQASTLKPTDIPNLNLTIDALKLGEIEVGSLAIKSSSQEGHWTLEDCHITSPSYTINVKGDWEQHEGKNNTKLQTVSQTSALAEALTRWKIKSDLEAHKGSVQLNLNWPNAMNQFSLASADGEMYIEFQNGRITHLSRETEEKLGFGKLLSILSLQTIPRRLKLDFSDLSKDGYSFDKFQGNFAIKKGVMSTSNAYIDGPVAYASMKGKINLVRQLYDLNLHVSPHITASLPIVATIAGGPIAGIAAWVASKIINQSMQEVTGYTYKVSGPWSNPVIQQVRIFKKKNRFNPTSRT